MFNYRLKGSLKYILLLAVLLITFLAASPAAADQICYDDLQGADDEPGQKDLNRLCIDYEPASASFVDVDFQWDKTGWTGNNTGDACILFDTNDNGFADYALCETVSQDPAQHLSTRLYQCTADSRPTRCMGGNLIDSLSVCTATVEMGIDPFHPEEADTLGCCPVLLSDLGGAAQVELLDVCTYPSEQPNSDPSDCVIAPSSPTAITNMTMSASSGPNINLAFLGVMLLLFAATVMSLVRSRKSLLAN